MLEISHLRAKHDNLKVPPLNEIQNESRANEEVRIDRASGTAVQGIWHLFPLLTSQLNWNYQQPGKETKLKIITTRK